MNIHLEIVTGDESFQSRAIVAHSRAHSAGLTFQDLQPQLKGTPNAARYIQFKIAMVKAAQSEIEITKQDSAISALKAFKSDHPDSWQIVTATKCVH